MKHAFFKFLRMAAVMLCLLLLPLSAKAEAVDSALPASAVDAAFKFTYFPKFSYTVELNPCPEGTQAVLLVGYRNGRMVMCDFISPEAQTVVPSKSPLLDYDTLKLFCLDKNFHPITFPKQLYPSNHSHTVVPYTDIEPTCTEAGRRGGSYCSGCGEMQSAYESLAPLGHTTHTVEGYAPTCTEAGLSDYVSCLDCGKVLSEQEYMAPLGHAPYIVEGYEATCSDWGKSDGEYCSRCEITLTAPVYTQPVKHTWYEETVTGDYIQRRCACGCVAKDTLNAASLDYAIEWNKYVGYVCTITGRGSNTDSDIVIPARLEGYPVQIVGEKAFYQEKGIRSIRLEKVNIVEKMAFAQCADLEEVYMPEVHKMGSGAFGSCEKLNYVYMPGIWNIADGAFGRCFSLNYIDLPDCLESIGAQAFANCGIQQIVIPYGVKTIAPNAFELTDNLFIYCEIDQKPFGWSDGWDMANYDGSVCTVFWNYREEGDERPIHNFCEWYEAQPATETTGRVMERYCYDCWEYETYAFEKKKVYYGTSTDPWLVDGTGLETKYVESKSEPFTVYADKGEYIYYYSPTDWGECTFHWSGWVLDIPLFGKFYVDGTEYYVYCFTNTGLGDITAFCT